MKSLKVLSALMFVFTAIKQHTEGVTLTKCVESNNQSITLSCDSSDMIVVKSAHYARTSVISTGFCQHPNHSLNDSCFPHANAHRDNIANSCNANSSCNIYANYYDIASSCSNVTGHVYVYILFECLSTKHYSGNINLMFADVDRTATISIMDIMPSSYPRLTTSTLNRCQIRLPETASAGMRLLDLRGSSNDGDCPYQLYMSSSVTNVYHQWCATSQSSSDWQKPFYIYADRNGQAQIVDIVFNRTVSSAEGAFWIRFDGRLPDGQAPEGMTVSCGSTTTTITTTITSATVIPRSSFFTRFATASITTALTTSTVTERTSASTTPPSPSSNDAFTTGNVSSSTETASNPPIISTNLAIIIGCGVGIGLLFLCIFVIADRFIFRNRRQAKLERLSRQLPDVIGTWQFDSNRGNPGGSDANGGLGTSSTFELQPTTVTDPVNDPITEPVSPTVTKPEPVYLEPTESETVITPVADSPPVQPTSPNTSILVDSTTERRSSKGQVRFVAPEDGSIQYPGKSAVSYDEDHEWRSRALMSSRDRHPKALSSRPQRSPPPVRKPPPSLTSPRVTAVQANHTETQQNPLYGASMDLFIY